MKYFRSIPAILLLMFFFGCAVSTPESPVRPAAPPMRRADAGKIRARCARIRTVLAPLEIRSVGLYPRAFDLGYEPGTICGFIAGMGFNRICFHISSESELDERLAAFLTAAGQRNLTVDVLIRQDNFHPRTRGNRIIRDMRDAYPDPAQAVRCIQEFNRNLPEGAAKIQAVTVLVEPHKFTAARQGFCQIYSWSEKCFGPGMDNDMLMKEALELLKKVEPGDLELTVAFPDFYHELAVQGKVTVGKIRDFAQCNAGVKNLMIMSAGNKPSQVVSGIAGELAAADKNQRVILGIELSAHTANTGSTLRRRDHRDLTRILDFIVKTHRKSPAFKGIMISPLSVLEFLITEQD